jgi:hypothetical protein
MISLSEDEFYCAICAYKIISFPNSDMSFAQECLTFGAIFIATTKFNLFS